MMKVQEKQKLSHLIWQLILHLIDLVIKCCSFASHIQKIKFHKSDRYIFI